MKKKTFYLACIFLAAAAFCDLKEEFLQGLQSTVPGGRVSYDDIQSKETASTFELRIKNLTIVEANDSLVFSQKGDLIITADEKKTLLAITGVGNLSHKVTFNTPITIELGIPKTLLSQKTSGEEFWNTINAFGLTLGKGVIEYEKQPMLKLDSYLLRFDKVSENDLTTEIAIKTETHNLDETGFIKLSGDMEHTHSAIISLIPTQAHTIVNGTLKIPTNKVIKESLNNIDSLEQAVTSLLCCDYGLKLQATQTSEFGEFKSSMILDTPNKKMHFAFDFAISFTELYRKRIQEYVGQTIMSLPSTETEPQIQMLKDLYKKKGSEIMGLLFEGQGNTGTVAFDTLATYDPKTRKPSEIFINMTAGKTKQDPLITAKANIYSHASDLTGKFSIRVKDLDNAVNVATLTANKLIGILGEVYPQFGIQLLTPEQVALLKTKLKSLSSAEDQSKEGLFEVDLSRPNNPMIKGRPLMEALLN